MGHSSAFRPGRQDQPPPKRETTFGSPPWRCLSFLHQYLFQIDGLGPCLLFASGLKPAAATGSGSLWLTMKCRKPTDPVLPTR